MCNGTSAQKFGKQCLRVRNVPNVPYWVCFKFPETPLEERIEDVWTFLKVQNNFVTEIETASFLFVALLLELAETETALI